MPEQDRRVVKTKRAIRNAFAELLTTREMDDITISDIAEVADINRKTFYSHYAGIHDLVAEIENEIVASFDDVLAMIDLGQTLENPYPVFARLTDIINSDMDFYTHLMRVNRNSSLINKLSETLKARMMAVIAGQSTLDGAKLELAVEYVSSGMFSAYQRWFNSERGQSIEEISSLISMITVNGVSSLFILPIFAPINQGKHSRTGMRTDDGANC